VTTKDGLTEVPPAPEALEEEYWQSLIAQIEAEESAPVPSSMGDGGFWEARPLLAHIKRGALERMASPWSVLGAVLARACCEIPTAVALPPIVGSPASLNVAVAIVAASGEGKGISSSVARDLLLWPQGLPEPNLGTGEGVVATYARPARRRHGDEGDEGEGDDRPPEIEWLTDRALFRVDEVDSIGAQAARRGATVMPVIRSAWSGSALGFAIANRDNRLILPAHSYRFACVLDVQPGRAQFLLKGAEASGGTAQRMLWFPARDTRIVYRRERASVRPVVFSRPRLDVVDFERQSGLSLVDVCGRAWDEVGTARADVMSGRATPDPLDGHAMLNRLKVAAILGFLDGRWSVTEEDWDLASVVMATSKATRDNTVAFEMEEAVRLAGDRARLDVVTQEARHSTRVERVGEGILRFLRKHGGEEIRWWHVNRALPSVNRAFLADAQTWLIENRLVLCDGVETGCVVALTEGACSRTGGCPIGEVS
jgi:hypothetical protein